jgi:glycosyltransferase involved in cell wall biosynthesis
MDVGQYTALVRTFNSDKTLPHTLHSLACQTQRPTKYVFVDSGSRDRTTELAPENSVIHHYVTRQFNYSESLNAGVVYVDTAYTLVMSSHTCLENEKALEFAMEILAENEDIAAAYFVQTFSENMTFERIGPNNFSGFNGVWNTCAIYKTNFLKERQFRPEVFSAEDQEWSSWLVSTRGKFIARVSGAGMYNNNPLADTIKKSVNEKFAVAIYVIKDMQRFPFLLRVSYRVVRPVSKLKDRLVNFRLLLLLMKNRLSGRKRRDMQDC